MNAFATMLHVLRKDLRYARWWLLAYLILTAMATAVAMELLLPRPRWSQAVPPLLWAVGALIVVFVVQADAPTNSRAFWTSRPIHGLAMLASKLLLVALLVGVPAIPQWFTVREFGDERSIAVGFLLTSVWWYAQWLLLCAIASAVTTRFVSALGVMLGSVAFFALCNFLFQHQLSSVRGALSGKAWGAIAMIGVGALLVAMYRLRPIQRRWIAASILFATVAMLGFTTSTASAVEVPAETPSLARARLAITDVLRSSAFGDWPQLSVSAAGMDVRYRYTFTTDSLALTGETGVVQRTRHYGGLAHLRYFVRMDDWTAERDSAYLGDLVIPLRPSRSDSLGRSLTAVRLSGRVDVSRPDALATLPQSQTRTLYDGGARVEWTGIIPGYGFSSLYVTYPVDWTTDGNGMARFGHRYRVRLVWPASADTALMRVPETSGRYAGSVLPGVNLGKVHWSMALPDATLRGTPIPPLAGAQIQLIRWTPLAQYPVVMEHAIALPLR